MAYKEEFQSNNAGLQTILSTINSLRGGTTITSSSFVPTNSGKNTYKSKFNDNNIDLQKLLEIALSLPIPITITYNANGGSFINDNVNIVEYAGRESTSTITKISKTDNVSEDGLTYDTAGYGNNKSVNDIIKIDGSESLEITITYETESTDYDWVCIYDGTVTPSSSNYSSSISNRLGGRTKITKTFTVNGDTVQIYFRSDGSVSNFYGYYAVITGASKKMIKSILSGVEEIPSRDGYEFGGWYLDAACSDGKELHLDNITSNTIVYAKWIKGIDEALAMALIDFEYTYNAQDDTVTLISWKGTLNGIPSTEIVIPDDTRIIL